MIAKSGLAVIILSIILVVVGLVARGYIAENSRLKDSLETNINSLEQRIGEYEQNEIIYRQEIIYRGQEISQLSNSLNRALGQINRLELERDFYQESLTFWKKAYSGKDISYREFASVEELEEWLAQDPISDRRWHPLYDCDDFAMDLTLSALGDGYWIGLGATNNHLFNFTIIGNDVYRIEASQDEVEPWGTID